MTEDTRCCGSGTCIIDADGRCWCGQQWDGRAMSRAPAVFPTPDAAVAPASSGAATDLPGTANSPTERRPGQGPLR